MPFDFEPAGLETMLSHPRANKMLRGRTGYATGKDFHAEGPLLGVIGIAKKQEKRTGDLILIKEDCCGNEGDPSEGK